ncbi:MAG: segregation/condensation protein A [Phycisphaerales bacterium]|nr:segregation/condensation protein A [Phycisphaerales bacterium]
MNTKETYLIKLHDFEGSFDLLLFFIERDKLDILNIPIAKITNDFLDYIHQQQQLNIELSSDFILFAADLIRIKAKVLLPRKELDEQGNEINPAEELGKRVLAYKRFKEIAQQLGDKEYLRLLIAKRGNIQEEFNKILELAGEGTEIQSITLFKLMNTFTKVMERMKLEKTKVRHTVVQYNYTMEECRETLSKFIEFEKTVSFEKIFYMSENKVHAIFMFLSLLELVQQRMINIAIGVGRNNFIIEWNTENLVA